MSDMRHVYNAYAAVHNPEVKKSLEESRDAFSKMSFNQLTDQDLYEVSEEILEKVFFHHNLDVPTSEALIEAILSDAIAGDKSPLRVDKIERLTEAFASAFDRIKEKSIRVAKESYTDYRYKKEQLSRLSTNTDLDLPKQRLHQSLVAEDRKTVKSGLLEIIEGKVNAGLQAYLDKKKGKKTDDKEENGKEENGNGKSSKGGKPDFLDLDKDGDKKESMKKAAKDKKLKEAMIVTNADKKANTPAYQNFKKGMKNKKGEPVYKAADHMKEDLVASGVFSEQEITKLIWTEFDENYDAMRNPEKYAEKPDDELSFEQRRAKRMRDPKRGINSPAFKKFMADRGM